MKLYLFVTTGSSLKPALWVLGCWGYEMNGLVGNFPRGIFFWVQISTSSCISKARNLDFILLFFQTAAYPTTLKISINPFQFCFQYINFRPLLFVTWAISNSILPGCSAYSQSSGRSPLIPLKWHCKIIIVSYYSSV